MGRDLFTNVEDQRKRGSPTKDSATGIVYPSRNQAYKALAPDLGLDPNDQYGWYTLCRLFPGRFVDVRTGQPIDARGSPARAAEVRVGPQGRLVVPVALREAVGLHPGDTLLARAEEGRLVLEKREHVLARLKARFKTLPEGVSLVEDLIQERRAEARREGGV